MGCDPDSRSGSLRGGKPGTPWRRRGERALEWGGGVMDPGGDSRPLSVDELCQGQSDRSYGAWEREAEELAGWTKWAG